MTAPTLNQYYTAPRLNQDIIGPEVNLYIGIHTLSVCLKVSVLVLLKGFYFLNPLSQPLLSGSIDIIEPTLTLVYFFNIIEIMYILQ